MQLAAKLLDEGVDMAEAAARSATVRRRPSIACSSASSAQRRRLAQNQTKEDASRQMRRPRRLIASSIPAIRWKRSRIASSLNAGKAAKEYQILPERLSSFLPLFACAEGPSGKVAQGSDSRHSIGRVEVPLRVDSAGPAAHAA